jgi:hypothetical protein
VNTSKQQMLPSITEQSTYRHVAPREAVLVERLVVVMEVSEGRGHRAGSAVTTAAFQATSVGAGGPTLRLLLVTDVAVWMRPTVDMPEILATANSNCLNHRYLGNRCTSKEQRTILRKVGRFAAVPATRVLAHPAADDSRGWRYGELCNRDSNAMLALL